MTKKKGFTTAMQLPKENVADFCSEIGNWIDQKGVAVIDDEFHVVINACDEPVEQLLVFGSA